MKILNVFKKETKKVKKPNIEKLDKKQLEKVIGGIDETAGKGAGAVDHTK